MDQLKRKDQKTYVGRGGNSPGAWNQFQDY